MPVVAIRPEMNLIPCGFECKSCSEERLLIPSEDGSSRKDMPRFSRIFGKGKRGFLQMRKERFTKKTCAAKKRVKCLHSRQENEESFQDMFDSLNSSEDIAREGGDICRQLNNENKNSTRRRMAICEQLEKGTNMGNISLHELRKTLVVLNRLESYGLL